MQRSRVSWKVKAVGYILVLVLVLVGLLMSSERPRKSPPAPQPVPWPNHVEWSSFTVPDEGWMLCRPSTPADSSSKPLSCIEIPRGSQLYIPRVEPGLSPEQQQSKKWHTAD